MTCLLCLGDVVDENLIDISSDYGQQLNVASIVQIHFGICFHVSSDESDFEPNRIISNSLMITGTTKGRFGVSKVLGQSVGFPRILHLHRIFASV